MGNRIVELLKRLKERQEISDKVYNGLYRTGSKPGIYTVFVKSRYC